MLTDTQTDPAALTSQALHDFIHLAALVIQALHFFCSVRSINCGKQVHGLRVGYACTDRLYILCNVFNDNVHHLVGNQVQCLLCAIKSVLEILMHRQTTAAFKSSASPQQKQSLAAT